MVILSGLLSMFGWGTADFLGAISSRKIGSVLTLFWMQAVGSCIAVVYFLANFSLDDIVAITPKLFVLIAVIGFLQTLAYLSFYKGIKEGVVSLVSPIGASWAMITVPLSAVFLREPLEKNQILAIAIIISGIILISINLKEFWGLKKITAFRGVKEGLVAMTGWGISMFLLTIVSRELGWFIPVFLFRAVMVLSLVGYIIFTRQSFRTNFRLSFWFMLLLIGIFDVGAFFSYTFGVMRDYASIVAPIAASFSMVTIILARIFLREKLLMSQIFGIIGVITGLVIISIK